MILFGTPVRTFGLRGVLPADMPTAGDGSPLLNDTQPGDEGSEFLWTLLTPLVDATSNGTTTVDDSGGWLHTGADDGSYTQDYRILVMPPSGAVVVDEATISFTVGAGSHSTTGALSAQDAAISGAALHPHTTSGALIAQAAAIAGAADRTTPSTEHATTGALSAQDGSIAGAALHPHTTSGALSAAAATVAGQASHQHATTGALSADVATIAGSAVHTLAGVHETSGALQAQQAEMGGTALLVPFVPDVLPSDAAGRTRKWRYYAEDDEQPVVEAKPAAAPTAAPADPAAPAPTPAAPKTSTGQLLAQLRTLVDERRKLLEQVQRRAVQPATLRRAEVLRAQAEAGMAQAIAQVVAEQQAQVDDDNTAAMRAAELLLLND